MPDQETRSIEVPPESMFQCLSCKENKSIVFRSARLKAHEICATCATFHREVQMILEGAK